MRLERLTLTAFRNYESLTWRPQGAVSVLLGKNGAGKTNLMEAVSLLAPGRGLRGTSGAALAHNGTGQWGIAARIRTHDILHEIGTGAPIEDRARRTFRLDGQGVRAQAEIARIVACVWATPQMDRLFTDSSSGRRRFLDRLVVALNPGHAREIAAHERAIAQRNRLLTDRQADPAWARAAEDSIARHAVAVTAARMATVDELNATEATHSDFPRVHLRLDCPIAADLAQYPALTVEDRLRTTLSQTRSDDAGRGITRTGAHRADLILRDRLSGRPADVSSSGQQKAMLLGIILGHARLVARMVGEAPILLLDEPLVHLDAPRRAALLSSLTDAHSTTILSGTDAQSFDGLQHHAQFVTIADGHIADCA